MRKWSPNWSAAFVNSYKQLPLSLYQIQTKFRDEYRPRFGLLRVREFLMKDAYSFHADLESLNKIYDDFYAAYEKIFTRCGIPFVVVEAESGPIGGSASHEFMAACAAGEDTIVTSDKGNYAANVEKAEIGDRARHLRRRSDRRAGEGAHAEPAGHRRSRQVHEGEAEEHAQDAGLPHRCHGPTLASGVNPKWVVAVVRGDHEVNEAKLTKAAREKFGVDRHRAGG